MPGVGAPTRDRRGTVIGGRYHLEAVLGRGGFGEVWSAQDPVAARAVAIKLLHPEHLKKPATRARFAEEAEALARLDHPGIARLLDADAFGPEPYLVLALAPGRPLRAWIAEAATTGPRWSLEAVLRLVDGLADALQAAHTRGVVHRDLKPGNILLEAPPGVGAPVLIDFGLAKLLDAERAATTVGRVLGTPLYVSPEQITGGPIDPRSDLFALATITYELLTLRWAWARDWDDRPLPAVSMPAPLQSLNAPLAVSQRITQGLRPSLSGLTPDLTPQVVAELDRVLGRALKIDPSARPIDVASYRDELWAAAGRTRPSPPPPARVGPGTPPPLLTTPPLAEAGPPRPTLTPSLAPDPSRGEGRGWALLALGLLVALGLLGGALRTRPAKPPVATDPGLTAPEAPTSASTLPRAEPRPALEPLATEPPPDAQAPKPNTRVKPAQSSIPKTEREGAPSTPDPGPPDPIEVHLAALNQAPEDGARAEALSAALLEAASALPDPASRTSLKRCATAAMLPPDRAALERCVVLWRRLR